MIISDTKPNMVEALNHKPFGASVLVSKPGTINTSKEAVRFYPVSVQAGQSMGLLLALTYNNSFTINSPITS